MKSWRFVENASVSNPSLVVYRLVTGLVCFTCKHKIIVKSMKFVTSVCVCVFPPPPHGNEYLWTYRMLVHIMC